MTTRTPEDTDEDKPYVNLQLVRAIVIHHSATPRSASFESIRQHHMRDRGWTDIGYHYVIDGDGNLRYGRKLPRMGAHALGRNADTVGICVIGDNTKPAERWVPEQVDTLKRLLAALRMVFPDAITLPHSEAYQGHKTECPGMTPKALAELLR